MIELKRFCDWGITHAGVFQKITFLQEKLGGIFTLNLKDEANDLTTGMAWHISNIKQLQRLAS